MEPCFVRKPSDLIVLSFAISACDLHRLAVGARRSGAGQDGAGRRADAAQGAPRRQGRVSARSRVVGLRGRRRGAGDGEHDRRGHRRRGRRARRRSIRRRRARRRAAVDLRPRSAQRQAHREPGAHPVSLPPRPRARSAATDRTADDRTTDDGTADDRITDDRTADDAAADDTATDCAPVDSAARGGAGSAAGRTRSTAAFLRVERRRPDQRPQPRRFRLSRRRRRALAGATRQRLRVPQARARNPPHQRGRRGPRRAGLLARLRRARRPGHRVLRRRPAHQRVGQPARQRLRRHPLHHPRARPVAARPRGTVRSAPGQLRRRWLRRLSPRAAQRGADRQVLRRQLRHLSHAAHVRTAAHERRHLRRRRDLPDQRLRPEPRRAPRLGHGAVRRRQRRHALSPLRPGVHLELPHRRRHPRRRLSHRPHLLLLHLRSPARRGRPALLGRDRHHPQERARHRRQHGLRHRAAAASARELHRLSPRHAGRAAAAARSARRSHRPQRHGRDRRPPRSRAPVGAASCTNCRRSRSATTRVATSARACSSASRRRRAIHIAPTRTTTSASAISGSTSTPTFARLRWLALRGGIRGDVFTFDVHDNCAVQSIAHPNTNEPLFGQSCYTEQNLGAYREPDQRASTVSAALHAARLGDRRALLRAQRDRVGRAGRALDRSHLHHARRQDAVRQRQRLRDRPELFAALRREHRSLGELGLLRHQGRSRSHLQRRPSGATRWPARRHDSARRRSCA